MRIAPPAPLETRSVPVTLSPLRRSAHSQLALVTFALAVAGCDCRPQQLVKTLPPDVRVDTWAQQAASKIDVLWLIDDSGSMAPRQENLAKNFQAFINEFTRNKIDYRIAVTTTDVFKEAGRFVGSPPVLNPQTPNVVSAFAANVKVGIAGSPYEVGMDAARLAIDLQRAANDAQVAKCQAACKPSEPTCANDCASNAEFPFLRRDAYLYLIFVSDEDDKSAQDVRFFYRYFETAKGVGNDGTVTTAAIMGDVPSNSCGATPGTKYQALSALTGGEVGSICDTNFAATLKKLASNAVGLKRKFALQATPNLATLELRLKYPCNTPPEDTAPCAKVDATACAQAPADAQALACTPKQGAPDGWTWEAGNNVVFFEGESVPRLSAQIEAQYYEEGKGP
jgi:hypothetical protein